MGSLVGQHKDFAGHLSRVVEAAFILHRCSSRRRATVQDAGLPCAPVLDLARPMRRHLVAGASI